MLFDAILITVAMAMIGGSFVWMMVLLHRFDADMRRALERERHLP